MTKHDAAYWLRLTVIVLLSGIVVREIIRVLIPEIFSIITFPAIRQRDLYFTLLVAAFYLFERIKASWIVIIMSALCVIYSAYRVFLNVRVQETISDAYVDSYLYISVIIGCSMLLYSHRNLIMQRAGI